MEGVQTELRDRDSNPMSQLVSMIYLSFTLVGLYVYNVMLLCFQAFMTSLKKCHWLALFLGKS